MAGRSRQPRSQSLQALRVTAKDLNFEYAETLRRQRNIQQQNRLAKRQHDARVWCDSKLRILSTPCHCGRDHRPLIVISNDRGKTMEIIHCPVTFWGFLVLHGQEPQFTFEEMMEKVKNDGEFGGPDASAGGIDG